MVTQSRVSIPKPHRTPLTNFQFTPSKHPNKMGASDNSSSSSSNKRRRNENPNKHNNNTYLSSLLNPIPPINPPSIIIPAAMVVELYLVILQKTLGIVNDIKQSRAKRLWVTHLFTYIRFISS
ncbi:hypothetical protein Syun_001328 [Stephania yunnanensis]|uniref:Uncharacterized protein n=1 Tax=Stephania yunnanensis TaxID=152371 RepID=A0AAP0LEM0_9MAGN